MRVGWLIGVALVASCGSAPPPAPLVAAPSTPDPPPAIEAHVAPEPPPEPEPPPLPPCPGDPKRDQRRMPDEVVRLVAASKAMTVVDLGAGDGYFLCRLSRVAGRVIATEIGKALAAALTKRVEREQLANVDVVLAPGNDVGIGPGTADRILVVNVWHHLPDRKSYAARIARALAPGGTLVVVDFLPGGGHGIQPAKVIAELAAGGIDAAQIEEDLPGQYVIVGTVRVVPACDARLPQRFHCVQ